MKALRKTLCILLCCLMLVSLMPAGLVSAIGSQTDNSVSETAESTQSSGINACTQKLKSALDDFIAFIKWLYHYIKGLLGLNGDCEVTFETNGGSDIESVKVPEGGTLSEVPMPVKQDYAFTGWYTDEALTKQFYADAPIYEDITLYASYTERENAQEIYGDETKYVEDCATDVSFTILSSTILTSENLSQYVELSSFNGDIPALVVSGGGGSYTISPADPYPAGGHYLLQLKNTSMSFSGEEASIRGIVFRIHKDEVSVVELQDDIIYVLWKDVTTLGDGAYSVSTALYDIQTGDKLCIWSGKIDDKTQFCNIVLATQVDSATVIYTEESALEDILKDVDVYFKQQVPVSEYIQDVDTDKIAEDVKNSTGTLQITEILAKVLTMSDAFQSAVSSSGTETAADSGVFEPVQENNDRTTLSIDDLVPGLTVSASIGSAQNPNFYGANYAPWAVLTLSFSYAATIKGKVDIRATFVVKEYVMASMQGYKEWHGSDLHFDYAMNMYTQTQITLTVLIKSHDDSEDEYLNITEEIESLLNDDESDDSDPSSILKEVLGGKGDDIDLLDENLFTYSIPIIPEFPIFQVNFDLNFVVKVNFAVGISTGITLMSARQVGMCGSMGDGVRSYNYELPGNNRYSFDLYACGYLGFKAGLKMSISLSFYGLKDLGEVGLSGEVGAYLDIYGFIHLNISKVRQNGNTTTSAQGGLYLEVGIYVEINLFAKSNVFKAKAEYTAYEHKWPLFSLGSRYVLLRFKDNSNTFIMNSNTYNVSTSSGLLDAVYIDLTTGEEVTGSYADVGDFAIMFSSPYLSYDREGTKSISVLKDRFGSYAYTPRISSNTKRIDTTVNIYYLGSNLTFSKNSYGYAYKTVKFIWLDASLNPSKVLNTCKATYVFDINGVKKTIDQKYVLYGEVPGCIDLYQYFYKYKITGYTNDFNQAITQDTVYTVSMQTYQKLVSFITYSAGAWHFNVYAVNIGETPIIPAGYDSSRPLKTFTGWVGESGSNSRMPTVYSVGKADYDISKKGWNYVYSGLNTTAPLYSTSGTYEQCLNAYWSGRYEPANATYCESGLYLYTAQYENQTIDVKFVFPAMSYSAFNQNNGNPGYSATVQAKVGEKISAPTSYYGYPGCTMLGWDVNGDATADYTYTDLPDAQPNMTLTAVFKLRTHTVTVLDAKGATVSTQAVNVGNLPDVLSTAPAYSDGSGTLYVFKYWTISKSGSSFERWYNYKNPGIYENWTLAPCYEKLYTVTFDYNGGTLDGQTKTTMQLAEGEHNVSEYYLIKPSKADTVYTDYEFTGWDFGQTLNVTGTITVKAQYSATPIEYTAEFITSTGAFADGTQRALFTGGYDAYQAYMTNFLAANTTLATVYTSTNVFTFAAWDRYLGPRSTRYTARWSEAPRYYSVTFNSGEGTFNGGATEANYAPATYNSVVDFTGAYINTAKKPSDVYTTYKLSGWRDQNNRFYALSDTCAITENTTFTAVYVADQRIVYTVTLNAGAGTFADNTQTKTFSGYYGDDTNIAIGNPAWVTNYANVYYVFSGWSQAIPTKFTQNVTITAQYEQRYYVFTVTFDAGSGTFTSTGTNRLTQTYHYNDTIVMNEVPTKAEDEYFTYTFDSWTPTFAPVTFNRTYTAVYRAERKGTTLPPTGITVTDGVVTEDICTGSIEGYDYDMVQTYDDGVYVPMLSIYDDGLTFSGSSDEVYIVVEDTVNEVTFKDLTVSGSYNIFDAPLSLPFTEGDTVTKVWFAGDCSFANTADYHSAIRCEREATFGRASGENATLTLSSVNSCAFYCGDSVTFGFLDMTINATGTDEYAWIAGISGDGSGDLSCTFLNSTVTINSTGCGISVACANLDIENSVFNVTCAGPLFIVDGDFVIYESTVTATAGGLQVLGSVLIKDHSVINLTSVDAVNPAFYVAQLMMFKDFTGSFNVSFDDPAATSPAVYSGEGIYFIIDNNNALDSYNLGGTQVVTLSDENDNSYVTFAVPSGETLIPATAVSVSPKS